MTGTSQGTFGVCFRGWDISQGMGIPEDILGLPHRLQRGKEREKTDSNGFYSLGIKLLCPLSLWHFCFFWARREKRHSQIFSPRGTFIFQQNPALRREKGMIEQEEKVGFDWKSGKPGEEPPSLPGAPGISGMRGKTSLGIKLFLGQTACQGTQCRNFC